MNHLYQYTAVSDTGVRETGQLRAIDKVELAQQLQTKDMYLVRCRRQYFSPVALISSLGNLHLLNEFSSTLTLLLRARISLIDALRIMSEPGNSRSQSLCLRLLEKIEDGNSLSDAARLEAEIFGQVYPSLLALGETTGELADVLGDMEKSVQGNIELRQRARQLLLYPSIVGVVLAGVILFLMAYVVPELVSFIESVGQELPLHTRILIWFSGGVQRYWLQFLVLLLLVIALAVVLYRSLYSVRLYCDGVILLAPVFGSVLLQLKLAQFSHHLAVLGRSNVDLLEAMTVSHVLLGNDRLERTLNLAKLQVMEGSSLAEALQRDRIFPGLFCNLVRIGEVSGELTEMFEHISQLYQREARTSMIAAEQFTGPVLMAVAGGLMIWVIVSVLSPVYDAVIGVGAGYP